MESTEHNPTVPPAESVSAAVRSALSASRPARPGDRVVHLYSPLRIGKATLRKVTVSPLSYGDEIDLAEHTRVDLLQNMTGLNEMLLRKLVGPDVDAVISTVVDVLPERLRVLVEG